MDIDQANLHQLATEVKGPLGPFPVRGYSWGLYSRCGYGGGSLMRISQVVGMVVGPVQYN